MCVRGGGGGGARGLLLPVSLGVAVGPMGSKGVACLTTHHAAFHVGCEVVCATVLATCCCRVTR